MLGQALARGARELRSTLVEPDPWLREFLGGGSRTKSGVSITEQTALRSSAVAACVQVVSETVADLPCLTYERESADTVTRSPWDTYAKTLRLQPNTEMSAFEYWETITAYGMLWSKAEAYIERQRNGDIALWPLPPNRTELAREKLPTGTPGKVTPGPIVGVNVQLDSGEKRFIAWGDILPIYPKRYANDSLVKRARETIGLALAAEEYGARFYGQGASAGGFIRMPKEATKDQADRTEARYRAKHEGLDRSHLVSILEGGAEWQEVGIEPEAAQYIEGRQFSVEEICRWFRVPPHKIAHLLRATFSNIEHQSIEFVTDSIGPWLTRHEQALRTRLFGVNKYGMPGDRYAEFLVDKLLRGDSQARGQAYALAIQWGWITRNEVRLRENMPPIDGLDEPLTPLNMGTLSELGPDEQVRLAQLAELIARSYRGIGGNGSVPTPDYLPQA